MATIVPVTPVPIARSMSTVDQNNASNNKNAQCGNNNAKTLGNSNDGNAASTAVLLHTFVIRKKRFRVFYNARILVWERYQSKKDRVTVPIANILAINPKILEKDAAEQSSIDQNINGNVDDEQRANANQKLNSSTTSLAQNLKQFTIVYAKRIENSSNLNKWRHFTVTFQYNDHQVCQLWIRTLQHLINEQITRPKRLLLFVNPYGGKKRALQIYDYNVKPIFQLAGIDASVVISQRSNQIRDFIMTQSLEHFDGIVCIGGDGTFSEVFNGLIFRTIKDMGITDLSNLDNLPSVEKPIGIISGGSTDTVAYCLNGTCDIRTTVLNIALGQVNGMDLSSVSNQQGLLKFFASVMSYGFLGDVAIESEKFRWMGPKRYDYSGFKKLLLNRGYDGEISMLLAPRDNDPTKGPACLEKCQICASNTKHSTKTHESDSSKITNQSNVIQKANNTDDKSDNNNENYVSSGNSILIAKRLPQNSLYVKNDTKNKNISQMKKVNSQSGAKGEANPCKYIDDVDDADSSDNDVHTHKTMNGKFFMVNGANISCACPRSPNGFSKYCHLCDGYIDLILVRHTSFTNNLKFMIAMSSRNYKISDLSHVEIYRTKKFSFRPNGMQMGTSSYNLHSSHVPIDNSTNDGSAHTSVWNCDGEAIHESEVTTKSHRHLINVYRRGLYNAQEGDDIDGDTSLRCCY